MSFTPSGVSFAGLTFYLFALITIASGVMVISSRNPVHSVLWLILAFFNAAGLFLLAGAEFLAMILVVVYVGAVAVLFLFVVMMLDINFQELRRGFLHYLPIGAAIGLVLLAELATAFGTWVFAGQSAKLSLAPTPDPSALSNTHALARLFYTQDLYLFQIAGLILLAAMVGAIVLTLRARVAVRRQDIAHQIARRAEDEIEIRKVGTGRGL